MLFRYKKKEKSNKNKKNRNCRRNKLKKRIGIIKKKNIADNKEMESKSRRLEHNKILKTGKEKVSENKCKYSIIKQSSVNWGRAE